MSNFAKVVLVGVIVDASILVIAFVACVGYAWVSKDEVTIPGVFRAFFTTENGPPALNFEFNEIGMLVVFLAIAALSIFGSLRGFRKRAPRVSPQ